MPRLFVDDVAEVFAISEDRDEDHMRCVRGDLADIGVEEAVRQFEQAEEILRGLLSAAESIGIGTYMCLSAALGLASEAADRAERHAEPYRSARRQRSRQRS